MNTAVDQLAISVFKKPLDECSADEIRQLAQQYPWFAPGQLLLAKKLQAGNPSIYEEQVQKTSLYFQNRLWLHHLLNNTGKEGMVINTPSATEEKLSVQHVEEPRPAIWPETVSAIIGEPALITTEPLPIEEPVSEELTQQEYAPVLTEAIATEVITTTYNQEPIVQAVTEPVMEMPKLKIEPLAADAKLIFEPYHTVDYFASLGIKFKEEEKPKDHFGQQLKSFTEWLKTMKRVPASEIPTAAEASVEKKVEQMAEHSLAERHVITEAMAEVWEKQGNIARAEEIYRKLSLLDPLKTAYFAAKIDALKKTS